MNADTSAFPSPNSQLSDALNSQRQLSTMISDAPKCVRCSLKIYDHTLVSFSEQFWHKSCFRCMICHRELNDACFSNGKELYCTEDFSRIYRSECAGCSKNLSPSDIVRRVFGSLYHETCFKCTLCDRAVETGDRVYLRDDNKLICEEDYASLRGRDELDNPLHPENIRSLVNEQQADILSQTYANNPTPSLTKCRELRSETGLRIDTIQTWFREKRFRDKRFMENDEKISYGPSSEFFSMLQKAFAHDFIPPNVELTPDVICNGEVLLDHLPQSASVTYSWVPRTPNQPWVHCNSS